MRVCVTATHYLPAHKAGGPIPGIQGLVATLRGHQVHIVTGDRDLGDSEPFPVAALGTVRLGDADVTYLPPPPAGLGRWARALRLMRGADVVHVNSLHAPTFTLLPLLYLAVTRYRGAFVISPRGELADSALRLGRPGLKRLWGSLLRGIGADRTVGRRDNVLWLASSGREADDIRAAYPRARVAIVPETLRPGGIDAATPHDPPAGELTIISVGRVAPVKGTLDLVRGLARVHTPAVLHLAGLEQDPDYLAEIEAAEAQLPSHVRVVHHGALDPAELVPLLRGAHLFALLSRGENYGHAIGEALGQGCPVLLSDQTPWTFAAEEGAGRVLTTEQCLDPAVVGRTIDAFAGDGDEAWRSMSAAAERCAASGVHEPEATTYLEALARVSAR